MIDFLLYKENLLKKQKLFFFVVITLFYSYSNSLDLLLNIKNPRFFIFLNLIEYSISLFSISVFSEDLFFAPKTSGDI